MTAAGVPVVPGDQTGLADVAAALESARRIGYPVLIKAAKGGGGKGMRVVRDPARLSDALAAARREAQGAFGDDRLILERLAAPTVIGSYVHGTRIGTLVGLKGGDATLARDLAMHVAATNPQYVQPSDVPESTLAKEREILAAQAASEGKPAAIVDKMVEGRLRKYLAEICLTGQPFVKDPDTTVGKLLEAAGATVTGFLRYEVGEGIEKKQENFAEEVMAQVKAAEGRR